jgi:hypothetical protein
MRRRRSWIEVLSLWLLFAAFGYAGLSLTLPQWVDQQVRRVVGNTLVIGRIRLGFPLKLICSDVVLVAKNPGTIVSIRQLAISPLWWSWRRKTVWLRRLEVEEPRMRVRRTQQGTLLWPVLEPLGQAPTTASAPPASGSALGDHGPTGSAWTVVIQTLQVSGGTIEFVDEKRPTPFRGSLSELSIVGGPVSFPSGAERVSVAIQGRLVGNQQHAASVYCSGWLDADKRDGDVSCQLDPLRLAAFEPYYQGPLQVRVYDATLKATSQVTAKANQLDGRVKLEIGNLSEADLSVLGTTLVDIKELAGGAERVLTGELQISGPLDRPNAWSFQLVPGNEIVQRLVTPLLNRGFQIIRIKVGEQTIELGLTPATEEAMSNIEAVSKEVEEHLSILAPPSPAVETPTTEVSTPEAPEASSQEASPQPSATPASDAPASQQPSLPTAPPASEQPLRRDELDATTN